MVKKTISCVCESIQNGNAKNCECDQITGVSDLKLISNGKANGKTNGKVPPVEAGDVLKPEFFQQFFVS